jgi:hypothetical protein
MKIPSYRRLFKTDYKEEWQPLVDKLATSINNAFDTIYNALNKNLTFVDNINSTIATFTVSVDGNGIPKQTTQFKLDSAQTTVQGLIVIDCFASNDTSKYPNSGIFINFTKNDTLINVNRIKGLPQDVQFSVKVLMIS